MTKHILKTLLKSQSTNLAEEIRQEAEATRDDFIRSRLFKDPRMEEVNDTIEFCEWNNFCVSGACPICCRVVQHNLSRAIRRIIKAAGKTGAQVKVFAATVLPPPIEPGQLENFYPQKASRKFKAALKEVQMVLCVACWDYSFNSHKTGRYPPHWQPHLHVIILSSAGRQRIKSALNAVYKTAGKDYDRCPTPVKVAQLRKWKEWTRYILKPNFWGRVGVDDAKRFNKKTGKYRLCRATERSRVKNAQRMELLLHLQKIGIGSRIIALRCQVRSVRGRPAVVPMRCGSASVS